MEFWIAGCWGELLVFACNFWQITADYCEVDGVYGLWRTCFESVGRVGKRDPVDIHYDIRWISTVTRVRSTNRHL